MKEEITFLALNILIILFFFYISYYVRVKTSKTPVSKLQFLNGGEGKMPSFKNLMIGLVFGVVWGFIDNIGLFVGLDNFSKYIKGDNLLKAGIGNTYSGFISSIIGTFIASIAMDVFKYDDNNVPIWINTIGILLGCSLGVFVGNLFRR